MHLSLSFYINLDARNAAYAKPRAHVVVSVRAGADIFCRATATRRNGHGGASDARVELG